jgi:hypothetical protein
VVRDRPALLAKKASMVERVNRRIADCSTTKVRLTAPTAARVRAAHVARMALPEKRGERCFSRYQLLAAEFSSRPSEAVAAQAETAAKAEMAATGAMAALEVVANPAETLATGVGVARAARAETAARAAMAGLSTCITTIATLRTPPSTRSPVALAARAAWEDKRGSEAEAAMVETEMTE